MRNSELDEAQAGLKITKRNINNLIYADDITLMAESEEELKNLLMNVKEESQKAYLKVNIHKTKIMTSRSHHFMANRRGKNGDNDRFSFGGAPKSLQTVPAAMKLRCLLLGRKAMTSLDSILQSRNVTLVTK